MICDRSHLGEVVYASLYRGYSGNYVFELEDAFIAAGSRFHKQTKLVLLVTDNFSIIQDDGNSFDFSMIESEQDQFMRALKRSRITNKQIVNVHDGNGSFKAPAAILQEVL